MWKKLIEWLKGLFNKEPAPTPVPVPDPGPWEPPPPEPIPVDPHVPPEPVEPTPAPPPAPDDLTPVVEPGTGLDPDAKVKINGLTLRPELHPGGFSVTHELPALLHGGDIAVEVFEPCFVQFMTYPRVGQRYQLETNDLPGEGHGDISGTPGAFRTVSRSTHYRQIFTSGPCIIVMPLIAQRAGEQTLVKMAINPKPDRPMSTIWASVVAG